jgi:type IV pilus assembly protein PilC
MPTYTYTARDERGKAMQGTLVAPNPETLADQLKRTGYMVTKCQAKTERAAGAGWALPWQGVGYDDLVFFNVQLSTMVRVGLPLVTALTALMCQTDHPRLRAAIEDISRTVESGSSFSDALSRHPNIFSRLFMNMVRAGEASGKLDEILQRLAAHAKHQAELRQQLITALTYPAVLMVVGISVCLYLVTGVIPKFVVIFLEAGVILPLPTRLLYQLSQILAAYWWAIVAVVAGVVAGLYAFLQTPTGRRAGDRLSLKVPVIGDVVHKTALAQLSTTLSTLLTSGVPILDALAIAAQTCGNTVIAEQIDVVQTHVRQGGAIAEPLAESCLFPPMVVQMVTVGEASGTLDQMLAEVAVYYDEVVRHSLKRLMSLIEPAFLVIMGGMVGMIMASTLLPLFDMVSVIRR